MSDDLSPDDGGHPDSTPVNQFLEDLARTFQTPPPPKESLDSRSFFPDRLNQAFESVMGRFAERLEGGLDKVFLDRLVNDLPMGLGHALGNYVAASRLYPLLDPLRRSGKDSALVPRVPTLRLRLGKELHRLCGPLAEQARKLRQDLSLELGIPLPEVSQADHPEADRWAIEIRGVLVAQGSGCAAEPIEAQLRQVFRSRACDLLGIQEAYELLAMVRQTHPALAHEVVPSKLPIVGLRKLLRLLVQERVPVDLVTILETVADQTQRDPDSLNAAVRLAMSQAICQSLVDSEQTLHVVELDKRVKRPPTKQSQSESAKKMEKELLRVVQEGLKVVTGPRPVLVTEPEVRAWVRHLAAETCPELAVLSRKEIASGLKIRCYGKIAFETPATPRWPRLSWPKLKKR